MSIVKSLNNRHAVFYVELFFFTLYETFSISYLFVCQAGQFLIFLEMVVCPSRI
ncbi:hypothetical protein BCE_1582 [Bacillus cereus ATCC 10987]|uniref:Uncharacterized protein n=1 Tax=Bacillus cereus (strain ATCC 10987 / NRS 248) TaxID=222523 RepID=Q73B38_BACC1|nr:hypothetical protein BCE_1582 [Bacillus cereus ATCC 10987]